MNIKQLSIISLVCISQIACNGGGGSSGGGNNPDPTPTPMPSQIVYTFTGGNPLPVASTRVINTISPVTNKPFYQLNSNNYGNNAITGSNTNWNLTPFGNGTTENQNGVIDQQGNIDQVTNGSILIYSPSWTLINSFGFDSSVTLTYGIINNSNTIVYGFNSVGVYSCPIGGQIGSCNKILATDTSLKKIQVIANAIYASYTFADGSNKIVMIELNSGRVTQYNLNLPSTFQIDEFVPDPISNMTIYASALKPLSIYNSIFRCNLMSGDCVNLYDDITSPSNAYSQISADENSLYFINTQNSNLTLSYNIVKVAK